MYTFYVNNHSPIILPMLAIFPRVRTKFLVFSLSGKSKNQIPCFPCAVATLQHSCVCVCVCVGGWGPQVNKFEQVSSLGHQMSPAGGPEQ